MPLPCPRIARQRDVIAFRTSMTWLASRSSQASRFLGSSIPSHSRRAIKGRVDMRGILIGLALFPAAALAANDLVSSLEQRLRTDGVDLVNAYLAKQSSAMAELGQRTADCDTQAIGLTVKLSRGKTAKAIEVHREALRIAVGTCTENVLSLLSLNEVPRICASVSSWTITQTARELRRRMRAIETDDALRSTERGKACGAAYRFELENHPGGHQNRAAEPAIQVSVARQDQAWRTHLISSSKRGAHFRQTQGRPTACPASRPGRQTSSDWSFAAASGCAASSASPADARGDGYPATPIRGWRKPTTTGNAALLHRAPAGISCTIRSRAVSRASSGTVSAVMPWKLCS